MELSFSSLVFFFFFTCLALLISITDSATVVVDGVSKWKDPTVQVGDSVIFEHKNEYKLYIFQNRRAFNLCNFTQATLLTSPNSTSYTWHPSRLGYFYFSFNNGTTKPCEQGQKLAIKVSIFQPETSQPIASPPLSSGGAVSSSPSYQWPFRPRDSTTPSPAPSTAILPATSPGGGIPFINSNPAVPLPTGEVDSATIGPLPITSSAHHTIILQVVGFHPQVQTALVCSVLFLALL
ncbi:early nodulin-like protein 1 [Heracleum sosnowskyi]|uniref:Early nodulin-like protein 1 n=1 Tax=Heracleum sosnowskyi TaxID=360622 RepID=A0AAD8HQ95_9APIA|nr:early nodulin-like protein 1 [Heracleum sosnowskyi]